MYTNQYKLVSINTNQYPPTSLSDEPVRLQLATSQIHPSTSIPHQKPPSKTDTLQASKTSRLQACRIQTSGTRGNLVRGNTIPSPKIATGCRTFCARNPWKQHKKLLKSTQYKCTTEIPLYLAKINEIHWKSMLETTIDMKSIEMHPGSKTSIKNQWKSFKSLWNKIKIN